MLSCRYPLKKRQLQDDLESFLYVVLYTALRYMPNGYTERLKLLYMKMGELFSAEPSMKSRALQIGFAEYMGGKLDLPHAPPLVTWIEKTRDLVDEWLRSPYSIADLKTKSTTFENPGPVPSHIGLHNHDALLRLCDSMLEPELWSGVSPRPACDLYVDPSTGKLKFPVQGIMADSDCHSDCHSDCRSDCRSDSDWDESSDDFDFDEGESEPEDQVQSHPTLSDEVTFLGESIADSVPTTIQL